MLVLDLHLLPSIALFLCGLVLLAFELQEQRLVVSDPLLVLLGQLCKSLHFPDQDSLVL